MGVWDRGRKMTQPPTPAGAMTSAEHRKGVLLMIGATLCWSTAGMLVRNLSVTDGWEIIFWRSLFMTIVIVGVLVAQYGGTTLARIYAIGTPGLIVGALWALMYVSFIL